MKRRTTQYETFTRENGEELELELPISLEYWENPEVVVKATEAYVVLGYLAHDNSCENPLESCDAMGQIHHHPDSRYGSRNSDYYDILGCDSYGEPCNDNFHDIDAVLLDRYEHGLCKYTIRSDSGDHWDTSRGEAVWVPDKYLREELVKITDAEKRWEQAKKYAEQACEEYTDWANGNCYGYVISVYDKVDGELIEEDNCWGFVGYEYAEEERDRMVEYFVEKYSTRLPDRNQLTLSLTESE